MKTWNTTNGETYLPGTFYSCSSGGTTQTESLFESYSGYTASGSSHNEEGYTADYFGNYTSSAYNSHIGYMHSTSPSTDYTTGTSYSSSTSYSYSNTGYYYYYTSVSALATIYAESTVTSTFDSYGITGTTLSGGGYTTTYTSFTASTIGLTGYTTLGSTWENVLTSAYTDTPGLSQQIGTAYQIENCYENIWVVGDDVPLGGFSALTDVAFSTTSAVVYPQYYTTAGGAMNITVLNETATFPHETYTFGINPFTVTVYGTIGSTQTGTITVTAQQYGSGDIPYSTTTALFSYVTDQSLTSTTYAEGYTYSIAGNGPNWSTKTFLSTFAPFYSYSDCSSTNGISTVNGTSVYTLTTAYIGTTNITVGDGAYVFPIYSQSSYGSISTATQASGISVSAQGSYIVAGPAANTTFFIANQSSPVKAYVTAGTIGGVAAFSSSFDEANPVYSNYQLEGPFSYLYYPWKGTAIQSANEVYETFADYRTASVVSTNGDSVGFSYEWLGTDTVLPTSFLAVTQANIVTSTVAAGTTTTSTTTATNTQTGTALISYAAALPASYRFSIVQQGMPTAQPWKAGGYPMDSSYLDSVALTTGYLKYTQYSSSTNSSAVSSTTGDYYVSDSTSFSASTPQITVFEPYFIVLNTDNSYGYGYNPQGSVYTDAGQNVEPQNITNHYIV